MIFLFLLLNLFKNPLFNGTVKIYFRVGLPIYLNKVPSRGSPFLVHCHPSSLATGVYSFSKSEIGLCSVMCAQTQD